MSITTWFSRSSRFFASAVTNVVERVVKFLDDQEVFYNHMYLEGRIYL